MESGPAVNTKGEFLSFLEVQCPIPESNVMKGKYVKMTLIKYVFSKITNAEFFFQYVLNFENTFLS